MRPTRNRLLALASVPAAAVPAFAACPGTANATDSTAAPELTSASCPEGSTALTPTASRNLPGGGASYTFMVHGVANTKPGCTERNGA